MSECVNLFFLLFDKEFDLWWDVNGMKHSLMEGRGEILKILTIYSQVGKEVHLRRHISLSISCINWHLLHYLILKKKFFQSLHFGKVYIYIWFLTPNTCVQIEKSALCRKYELIHSSLLFLLSYVYEQLSLQFWEF